MNHPKITAILLSGGTGTRLGSATPKQYLPLQGKPLVSYSLELFESLSFIREIIVVCSPSFQKFFTSHSKPIAFALPGKERQNSLANGFSHIFPPCDYVLVHDAARPLVSIEDLTRLIEEGMKAGAATLGTPVTSTLKRTDSSSFVQESVDRNSLYEIQTPQLLRYDLLLEGLKKAEKENKIFTDDTALATLIGHPVKIVPGSLHNRKITTRADLDFAHYHLEKRCLVTN